VLLRSLSLTASDHGGPALLRTSLQFFRSSLRLSKISFTQDVTALKSWVRPTKTTHRHQRMYERRCEVKPPMFFSENVIAITIKITQIVYTYFAIMRLFFHKVSVIFNTCLPTFSTTLYTRLQNSLPQIRNKTRKRNFSSLLPAKCQIWAFSSLGKTSQFNFCDCLTCAQAGVRLGIVVKEKDVFHVSVRMNCTDAL
jgi:hypothetical protein